MSTFHQEKIKAVHLYDLKNSPCKKCLVQSTCTKSFIYKTACDKYKWFVIKIINQEKSCEIKK